MPCGARVRESRAAAAISGALHRHSPVVANQAVADGPTKTIGAKHGLGRSRFAMIFASPDGLAGDGAVATFTVVTPPSVGVRQLTTAWKLAIGLVPCSASGTGAASSKTRPRTFTSSLPLVDSCPLPSSICQGSPPPLMPRIGLVEPTKGPLTATMVWKLRIFCPFEAAAGDTVNPTPTIMPTNRTNNRFISAPLRVCFGRCAIHRPTHVSGSPTRRAGVRFNGPRAVALSCVDSGIGHSWVVAPGMRNKRGVGGQIMVVQKQTARVAGLRDRSVADLVRH